MKTGRRMLGGIVAVLVAMFIVGGYWYRSQQARSAEEAGRASRTLLVRPYSPTQGPEQADVTLVEFFDPECESCGAMYPIVKRMMAEFDGRVRLVIRYMPLHQNSIYAATLLEAARSQSKYWELLDIVMLRQREWASHYAPRPDLLMSYASEVGLDAEQLRVAASDAGIRARIQQDQSDGVAVGARRTPTFFINGKLLLQLGDAPLRAAIQAELR